MTDPPTFTRIPNEIIEAMPTLGNAELRVLLAIARKTIGYQKESDRISFSQIEDMTGLAHRHVSTALQSLTKRGFIGQEKVGKQAYEYSVKPVPVGNQFPTGTSSPREPEPVPVGNQLEEKPVPLGNTQKKESLKKKERSVSALSRTPHTRQTNLDSLSESVTIYKQLTNKSPPPTTVTLIAATVVDSAAWQVAIKAWCDRGFKPGNVEGMIDWYLHPEKQQQRGSGNGKLLRQDINGHSERGIISETDLDRGFT